MKRLSSAMLVATIVSLTSCEAPHEGNEGKLHIVGAGPDLPAQDARARATVGISIFSSSPYGLVQGLCTGTLVAPNLVLTAAHCLHDAVQVRAVYFGSWAMEDAVPVSVESFAVHPDYDASNQLRRAMTDIAWIKLAGPLPPGARPARLLADHKQLSPGEMATVVGFGSTSSWSGSDARKRQAQVPILAVLDGERLGQVSYENVITTGTTPGVGACYGDSGGPLFLEREGEWRVAGLVHGADIFPEWDPQSDVGACDIGKTAYVAVDAFRKWIESSSGVGLDAPWPAPLELPHCTGEERSSVLHGGYCVRQERDGTLMARGPFSDSLVQKCVKNHSSEVCNQSLWSESLLKELLANSPLFDPPPGEWASSAEIADPQAQREVEAWNKGVADPVARDITARSEGNVIVGWDAVDEKDSIKYCIFFSSRRNSCRFVLTLGGEFEVSPKGRCTWSIPAESTGLNPYGVLGVSETGFNLNHFMNGAAVDVMVGLMSGGARNEPRPSLGQSRFLNPNGPGLTIEKECPVALPDWVREQLESL